MGKIGCRLVNGTNFWQKHVFIYCIDKYELAILQEVFVCFGCPQFQDNCSCGRILFLSMSALPWWHELWCSRVQSRLLHNVELFSIPEPFETYLLQRIPGVIFNFSIKKPRFIQSIGARPCWFFWVIQGIEQKMMEPLPGDLVLDRSSSTATAEERLRVRPLREGEEKDTAMAEILWLGRWIGHFQGTIGRLKDGTSTMRKLGSKWKQYGDLYSSHRWHWGFYIGQIWSNDVISYMIAGICECPRVVLKKHGAYETIFRWTFWLVSHGFSGSFNLNNFIPVD